MAHPLIPADTVFGKLTAEMTSDLLRVKATVKRIKAACAAAGGSTALESDTTFMVAAGSGGTYYQAIIDIDAILNAATGALTDAALGALDMGD